MNINIATSLTRLQDWFSTCCDGDWEHSYGISIETTDNPGWLVEIDLTDTPWEGCVIAPLFENRTELDWVRLEITNSKFRGMGGRTNLVEIIERFFDAIVAAPHIRR